MFEPTGKYNFVCLNCMPKSNKTFWNRLIKLQKKNDK